MNDLPKISIRVDGSMTPQECVELARAADEAGLTSVWFAENAFARGILPAAAACAVATKHVQISAGVFNPYSRHPTMMAMEIGALDELSDGRASISIGAGIMSATEKMALNADKPLPALRDTLMILGGLLAGREVEHVGAFFSAKKVKLDYAIRKEIPVYLAGRGNLTVKLAGEAASGLIVSNMCSAKFAGKVAALMRTSRSAAGRKSPGKVIQYMPASVSAESLKAKDAAKRMIGEMLPRFWSLGQKLDSAKEALLAGTNISEPEFSGVAARIRSGEDPASVLDDRFATAFSVCGTPDECLALAKIYKANGVDALALTFGGSNAKDEIKAIGEALVRARGAAR
ncbi:MAG: LLM class flavin-dependent oxidoreductase [Rhizobiales bacterium]|nr:LLM class flavin-dependent oxidoreductase [Hyphomicrobiales bacterium]